jgi:hypothetical protein
MKVEIARNIYGMVKQTVGTTVVHHHGAGFDGKISRHGN